MPGMVYASIERSPVFGGTLVKYDDAETRKVAGVQQTLVIDPSEAAYSFQPLGGVAVIADNTWAAMQGRKKLKIDWDAGRECRSTNQRPTRKRSPKRRARRRR